MASELNANYDEASLYCEECGNYWTDCECNTWAKLMEWWDKAEDETNARK